jgi:hypothetical protein
MAFPPLVAGAVKNTCAPKDVRITFVIVGELGAVNANGVSVTVSEGGDCAPVVVTAVTVNEYIVPEVNVS